MRRHWDNLQYRERLTLLFGVAAVVMLMFYAFVLAPFSKESTRLEKSVAEQQLLLSWMDSAAQEVDALRRSRPAKHGREGESLMALVDRTGRSAGLDKQIKRIQPEGSSKVRLWLEAASFDKMVLWFKQLETRSGIYIESIVVDSTDAAGVVDARLTLESKAE